MRRVRAIYDPLRFGFAVGRVRVLETRLLKRSTFERLLDAASFSDQRRILSETPYGSYLEAVETAEDVERALDRAQADLYSDFLETANLPSAIVRYFRTQHDFENLRGMLKAQALGIAPDDMLNDLGSVPAEAFVSGLLPAELLKAASRAKDAVVRDDGSIPVDLIDCAVDAEMYARLLQLAAEASNAYMLALARFGVDVANVKVLVRTRTRGLTPAEAERYYIEGGTVPVQRFAELHRIPLAEAAARLAQSGPLQGVDAEALADPQRFDVVVDAAAARLLREAAMVPVGPEPVVAYVISRRAEISMLRTLLIGRLAGVSTDVLRGRVRGVA